MTDSSGPITRAEAERMIADAVAAERKRCEAEMQTFADEVSDGFSAVGVAVDSAADAIGRHNGYIVDLMTIVAAEEVRSGRISVKRRPRHRRPSW